MPPDRYENNALLRILAGLDLLVADGTRIDEDLRVFVRTAIRAQRPLFTGQIRAGDITLNEVQAELVEAALRRESLSEKVREHVRHP